MKNEPLVKLVNIQKSFGRVYALEGINLELYPGEIVSLVGDNGAGKSTLTKIISGTERPDVGGKIFFEGVEVKGWNAAKARSYGIETVHQSRALSEQQSIYANVFLGRELTNKFGFVQRKKEVEETEKLMRRIGYTSKVWTPNSSVNKLSGGERQGVAISRAILFESRLVMLDEPTTAMALSEAGEVIDFIKDLKNQGKSVIFISHNPWDAHSVADRFVILDRGRIVFDGPKGDMTPEDFIARLHNFAKNS
ncbi:MAG: ATP-binding cassette domain-containing protein [bacterium]|jgi:simple sugar transport system ATP-binding protein